MTLYFYEWNERDLIRKIILRKCKSISYKEKKITPTPTDTTQIYNIPKMHLLFIFSFLSFYEKSIPIFNIFILHGILIHRYIYIVKINKECGGRYEICINDVPGFPRNHYQDREIFSSNIKLIF